MDSKIKEVAVTTGSSNVDCPGYIDIHRTHHLQPVKAAVPADATIETTVPATEIDYRGCVEVHENDVLEPTKAGTLVCDAVAPSATLSDAIAHLNGKNTIGVAAVIRTAEPVAAAAVKAVMLAGIVVETAKVFEGPAARSVCLPYCIHFIVRGKEL